MGSNHDDTGDLKRQLERLDQNYRRLVESISEGVSVVSLDGVIMNLSPAFETLMGWPNDQLIGSQVFPLIHPADLPLVIERMQREQNGERLPPFKLRLLQRSGEYLPVEVITQPEIENNEITRTWALVRDLSKDEQLQSQQVEIAAESQRVKALLELIRAAYARAQSRLTVASLTTNLLSKQVTDPDALSSVDQIERQIQRLIRLTERVLKMAELDADRANFSFRPVSLNRLVNYVEVSLHTFAETKQIAFTVKSSDDFLMVRADEIYLYRAVQEVVENALEYTPENGSVTITTLRKDSYGIVEVLDTGIGIAPEIVPHLFERFYHLSILSSVPSKLGLGLPIAKKIIEKHNGTINVTSTPLKGTIVAIAIPLDVL